jgi:hypothetical protein
MEGVRAVKASQRSASGGGGSAVKIVVPAIVVVVVLGVVAWMLLLRSTPAKTVARYVAASKAGDEQAAKACLTADSAKAVDDLQKSMPAMPGPMAGSVKFATSLLVPPGLNLDVAIGKSEVKGDSATVQITLVPKGGAKGGPGAMAGGGGIPLTLKREGGQWKIDTTQEVAMIKQMMAYFAGGGGAFQQMGQQVAQNMGAPPSGSPSAPAGTPPAGGGAAPGGGAADLVKAGMADKTAGRLDAAAAKFQQALQMDANNSDAHWGMAWVLAAQGKKPEARADFEKVSKLSTDPKRADEGRQALARLK